MIKQNESELANTVFKIELNKAGSFFCFLLFVQSFNCLYFWNQLPNLCGVFTKLKPKQYPNRKCQKTKNHIFQLQTHFAWSHHIYYRNKCTNWLNKWHQKKTLPMGSIIQVRQIKVYIDNFHICQFASKGSNIQLSMLRVLNNCF